MVRYSIEQLSQALFNSQNLRNLSVIAHVDHGKSTLIDSLISNAGLMSEKKTGQSFMDTRPEEQARYIPIKSTGVSLYFDHSQGKDKEVSSYVFNVVVSPGNVDFSAEDTSTFSVTDGAIVVVDCIEGVCVQTKTLLRQALSERVKPVLVLNKLDRLMFELSLEEEDTYQVLAQTIESFNVISNTYSEGGIEGGVECFPEAGTVLFASGIQGWGFSLRQFAELYSKKFGVQPEKLLPRLWGENYYDPSTKKWVTSRISPTTGKTLRRGFCQFVLEPVYSLFNLSMDGELDKLDKTLQAVNITLTEEEKQLGQKQLFKASIKKFLPLGDALVELIVTQLPSPVKAQKYRVHSLYKGPLDDECATAIAHCDPEGPVVMYLSKQIPLSSDPSRFYAVGRIISGTVKVGQKVRLLGSSYLAGSKSNESVRTVQKILMLQGRTIESLDESPCGTVVNVLDGENSFVVSVHPKVSIQVSLHPDV